MSRDWSTTAGDGPAQTLRAPVPLDHTLGLPAEPSEPDWSSGRTTRRPRGRTLARLALGAAVLAALLLGVSSYLALASVHLISAQPLADATGWLVLLAAAAVGAVAALGLALLALLWCRPRLLAGLALVASVLMPVLTVAVGVAFGVGAAQQNLVADAAREPAAVADLAVDAMDTWGIDAPGPVRELLESVGARNGR